MLKQEYEAFVRVHPEHEETRWLAYRVFVELVKSGWKSVRAVDEPSAASDRYCFKAVSDAGEVLIVPMQLHERGTVDLLLALHLNMQASRAQTMLALVSDDTIILEKCAAGLRFEYQGQSVKKLKSDAVPKTTRMRAGRGTASSSSILAEHSACSSDQFLTVAKGNGDSSIVATTPTASADNQVSSHLTDADPTALQSTEELEQPILAMKIASSKRSAEDVAAVIVNSTDTVAKQNISADIGLA